jgi:hypothetical protein
MEHIYVPSVLCGRAMLSNCSIHVDPPCLSVGGLRGIACVSNGSLACRVCILASACLCPSSLANLLASRRSSFKRIISSSSASVMCMISSCLSLHEHKCVGYPRMCMVRSLQGEGCGYEKAVLNSMFRCTIRKDHMQCMATPAGGAWRHVAYVGKVLVGSMG